MKRSSIKTTLVVALLAALPAAAYAQRPIRTYEYNPNSLRLWAANFEPDGESDYWSDTFDTFTGEISDFDDVAVGVDYIRALGERLSLQVGISGYEGETVQAYRSFTDSFGDDIFHDTTLSVNTGTLGLLLNLTRRDAAFVPYVGAGVGVYDWELVESGDFIDFFFAPPEIFSDTFVDDGATFGWYWLVGVDVPVSTNFSVFGQARWHRAEDELGGDFEGLAADGSNADLDLSGREIGVGLSWKI